jgi:hypothetical protein
MNAFHPSIHSASPHSIHSTLRLIIQASAATYQNQNQTRRRTYHTYWQFPNNPTKSQNAVHRNAAGQAVPEQLHRNAGILKEGTKASRAMNIERGNDGVCMVKERRMTPIQPVPTGRPRTAIPIPSPIPSPSPIPKYPYSTPTYIFLSKERCPPKRRPRESGVLRF